MTYNVFSGALNPTLSINRQFGFASYGALGHVPPWLPTVYFFSSLQSCTKYDGDCAVASPNILVFCDSSWCS